MSHFNKEHLKEEPTALSVMIILNYSLSNEEKWELLFISTCPVGARLVSCDSLMSRVQYEPHMEKADKNIKTVISEGNYRMQ